MNILNYVPSGTQLRGSLAVVAEPFCGSTFLMCVFSAFVFWFVLDILVSFLTPALFIIQKSKANQVASSFTVTHMFFMFISSR